MICSIPIKQLNADREQEQVTVVLTRQDITTATLSIIKADGTIAMADMHAEDLRDLANAITSMNLEAYRSY